MDYNTAKQKSKEWGVSVRVVQKYCSDGVIIGATKMGSQWFIPVNAPRPTDRRKSQNDSSNQLSYFFPLFIFTRNLSSSITANVPAALLNPAQLFLEGKLTEAQPILRNLSAEETDLNIRFSATVLLTLLGAFSGSASDYKKFLVALDTMVNKEDKHREDFRLCYAFLLRISLDDYKLLPAIDTKELSDEGLNFYSICLLMSNSFSSQKQPKVYLATFEYLLRQMENNNIVFGSMCVSALLGINYSTEQEFDKADFYAEQACKIAFQNNWLPTLAMVYPGMKNTFAKYLIWNNNHYLLETQTYFNQFKTSMASLHAGLGKEEYLSKTVLMDDHRVLQLLVRGSSNSEIADEMDVSVDVVKQKIDSLIQTFGARNRTELRILAKQQFKEL